MAKILHTGTVNAGAAAAVFERAPIKRLPRRIAKIIFAELTKIHQVKQLVMHPQFHPRRTKCIAVVGIHQRVVCRVRHGAAALIRHDEIFDQPDITKSDGLEKRRGITLQRRQQYIGEAGKTQTIVRRVGKRRGAIMRPQRIEADGTQSTRDDFLRRAQCISWRNQRCVTHVRRALVAQAIYFRGWRSRACWCRIDTAAGREQRRRQGCDKLAAACMRQAFGYCPRSLRRLPHGVHIREFGRSQCLEIGASRG